MSIYASLFDKRATKIGGALESLAGKNARNALGMFADIIASPHIPTNQIGSVAAVKQKIDFSIEGYASGRTIVNRMGQLGYDERDAFIALSQLAKWNLVQPESLLIDEITLDDPVQVHASGFIHMRYFLKRPEYLFGVTADMNFSSYEIAEEFATMWSSGIEPGFRARRRGLKRLADYFEAEYQRRVRRHAFYEDLGYGGRNVVLWSRNVADTFGAPTALPRAPRLTPAER
jgi:hypothetical protein